MEQDGEVYRIEKCDSKVQWDEFVLEKGGHPLQLWGWGDVKAAGNWVVDRFFVIQEDDTLAAVQLLVRKLPKPFGKLLHIPRGPVVADKEKTEAIYAQIASYVKKEYKSVALIVEPNDDEPPLDDRWKTSSNHILAPQTIVLDLSRAEGVLMAEMSKKTRQYIRKSTSDGVTVKRIGNPEDIDACLKIYKETARRAKFSLHKDSYYRSINDKLGDHSVIFGAYANGELVSFLWLALSESVAFELYGGVTESGQELRANYALKWEAIRRCKQWGVETFATTFEDGEENFGGQVVNNGSFVLPLSPLYSLWHKLPQKASIK